MHARLAAVRRTPEARVFPAIWFSLMHVPHESEFPLGMSSQSD
jgi:hypothetical protein